MSSDITELLDTFETQLRNESYDDAEETLRDLSSRFSAASDANAQTYARTVAATGRVDDEGELSAYAESATTIDLQQTQFLIQAASFLSAPETLDRGEVLSLVETLREAESTLSTRRQQAESTLQSMTVPPQPTILQVGGSRRIGVGETVELSVPVTNVGDEPTASLALAVTAGDLLAVDGDAYDIGTLAADAEQTVTVAVTGQAAGEGTVTLELTAEGTVADSTSVTVAVQEETGQDTTATATPSADGTADDGDGLLPIVGGAGLGALGGGAALYKYFGGDDESASPDGQDDT